jgi:hypothetical protein
MSMHWPSIAQISQELALPEGVTIRFLEAADIAGLPGLLSTWFPRIEVGAESVFLDAAFLRTKVASSDTLSDPDRDILALVLELRGKVRGFVSFEREPAARVLHARLGVLDPSLRVALLGALGILVFERVGQLTGAELLLQCVTLSSRGQQALAERRGFQLYGIMPAFDRDSLGAGRILRVTEALYGKALVAPEQIEPLKRENLTKNTQKAIEALGFTAFLEN